jgi:hypothetical protein
LTHGCGVDESALKAIFPNIKVLVETFGGGDDFPADYVDVRIYKPISTSCVLDRLLWTPMRRRTMRTENVPPRSRGLTHSAGANDFLPLPLPLGDLVLSRAGYLHNNDNTGDGLNIAPNSIIPIHESLYHGTLVLKHYSLRSAQTLPICPRKSVIAKHIVHSLFALLKVAASHKTLDRQIAIWDAVNFGQPLKHHEGLRVSVHLRAFDLWHLVDRVSRGGVITGILLILYSGRSS